MKLDYICPKCKGHLKIGNQIVLTVKKKGWTGGLILLHPELGNYKFDNHESFKFDEGEHFEFYCPICLKRLTSKQHDNLAMILMRDEKNEMFEVYFSQVKGEESTYCLVGNYMDIYGKDSALYYDYFELGGII